jgi:hypothetical protein
MYKWIGRGIPWLMLSFVWYWVFVCSLPTPVSAHDGSPHLRVTPHQVQAGAAVEVSGAGLGTDLPLTIVLTLGEQRWPLGAVVCDGRGDFTGLFNLPTNLKTDVYALLALDHSIPDQEIVMAEGVVQIRGQATAMSWGRYSAAGGALLALAALVILHRARRAGQHTPIGSCDLCLSL